MGSFMGLQILGGLMLGRWGTRLFNVVLVTISFIYENLLFITRTEIFRLHCVSLKMKKIVIKKVCRNQQTFLFL